MVGTALLFWVMAGKAFWVLAPGLLCADKGQVETGFGFHLRWVFPGHNSPLRLEGLCRQLTTHQRTFQYDQNPRQPLGRATILLSDRH